MIKLLKTNGKKRDRNWIHQEMVKRYGNDILNSKNFRSTSKNTQHGTMSVLQHSINVAKCSLTINERLGVKCRKKDLIRGALLHDYFLYDWHDKDHVKLYRLHGFFHPTTALRNASREYLLSPREKDIIKKHMWPLTIKPPACREAWVVTTADKYCSLMETLHIHQGRKGK
ncbi:MAG: HD domain-containing protein [Lachnospiraceae bacterium]|nr:HD domain-containing protein [Lachnospiraceae bacterium]